MQPRMSKRGRVILVVPLSVDSSVGPSVGSSIGLSVSLSVSPSISPSIAPSVLRFVRWSFRRSVRRFVPCIAAKNIVFCLKTAIFAPKHHFSPISEGCSSLKLCFSDSSRFFTSISPVSTKFFFEFCLICHFLPFFFLQQQPTWTSPL